MDRLRIDKWLWAARFFKTRSLAADAVEAGRAKVAEAAVKPAKEIKPGDRLSIRIGDLEWVVEVRALSDKRGPATVAQTLYEETGASRARRQQAVEAKRLAPEPAQDIKGRPTKRQRRDLDRWRE
jgi:ribosome-associated heat shock protein Hsp15